MQTQQTTATPTKENVFDENGQTVATMETADESEAPFEAEVAPDAEAAAPAPKYRIGDREFATQDEALAYATSQVSALQTETQVADAYRQGIRDAMAQAPTTQSGVTPAPETPAAPSLDPAELYTNPQEFLKKYETKIKSETLQEINQRDSLKAQSDQIWREFTDRHPGLADFRTDVESFVNQNQTDVRAIITTKGRPASYDFIATKLRARFEAYANALKPKRELPNTTAAASPTPRSAGVTPPAAAKKPLSFSEQVRSIRKRR